MRYFNNTQQAIVVEGPTEALGSTQPTQPGLWLNGGELTYYDGNTNKSVDTKSDVADTFGVIIPNV